jgi:hypothetical protein
MKEIIVMVEEALEVASLLVRSTIRYLLKRTHGRK